MRAKKQIILLVLSILTLFSSLSFAAKRNNITCGIDMGYPLTNAYGPWDYTNPEHQEMLPIVIGAHFNRDVAMLIKGQTHTLPHGDIDYTLRAIPNYHPALFSVSKLERSDRNRAKLKQEEYSPKYYTAECYLKRAVYFQPKDFVARMLYGMYLQQNQKFERAKKEYLYALSLQPNDPEVNYNLGLLYVDLKQLEKAKEHAKVAYSAGHPLPGLNNKIAKLSKELTQ